MEQLDWNRLALIAALSGEIAEKKKTEFGRTALMKLLYILQEIRGLSLEYDFSLYAYGPFDSAVLSDLSYAETLGLVTERSVRYPTSLGYDIKPVEAPPGLATKGKNFVQRHLQDIRWTVEHFGGRGAGELELISTIIYADREKLDDGERCTVADLAKLVRSIKPHFTVSQIETKANELLDLEVLKATDRQMRG